MAEQHNPARTGAEAQHRGPLGGIRKFFRQRDLGTQARKLEIDVQLNLKGARPENAWTLYSNLQGVQGLGKSGITTDDGNYSVKARFDLQNGNQTRLVEEISRLAPTEAEFTLEPVPSDGTGTKIFPNQS